MKISRSALINFGKIQSSLKNFVIAVNKKLHIEYINDYAEEILNFKQNVSLIGMSVVALFKQLKIPLSFKLEGEITNPEFFLLDNYFQKWQRTIVQIENEKWVLLIGHIITSQEEFFQKFGILEEKTTPTDDIINLNKIIENLPELVYWKDKNCVYQGCNKHVAELLNLACPTEIIGKTDYDFGWSSERIKSLYDVDHAILQHGINSIVEDTIPVNDTKKIFLTSKTPLHDNTGKIVGILGISTDITDRKKMEKDLEKAKTAAEAANHAKSEFIANISHDVRTPLTGIITFSRYLKEQNKLSDAERKEFAGDTYHASEQLLNLLNGVLDVVSADSATDHDLNLQSFNLKDMIDDLIKLEKPAVKSKQLELRTFIDKKIPEYIISDKMKVPRILLNLTGNSIKFTEKGYIKISATLQSKDKEKATVVFSVEDTGIGIPEEAQPKIFERFFKVSSSYKGKYTGNGIGLNIVQTYLRLLGGKIEFHSTFGKGTTFLVTLTFPIGKAPQEDAEDSAYKEMLKQEQEEILLEEQVPLVDTSATAAVDHIDATIKILLVEDNILALKSLKMLFMPFRLHVMETQNAEDAFQLVEKEAFDLIITDIGLPGMQGDELVAKIRQLEKETGRVREKIVALTGHAVGGTLANHCKKAGVDELFKKPMQPKLLKSLLEPLIKKGQGKTKPTPNPEAEVAPQEKPSSSKVGKLGVDLPDTEAQLFEIDHHPLLDLKVGVAVLGSEDLAKDILKNLNEDGIIPELEKLKKSTCCRRLGDWETGRL
jgi:two-component system, OmpR family, aerobic respiration control sensor histidine kinase ArcB